jgi:hypothetical protein
MSSLQQNWRKEQNRFYLEARGMGRRGRAATGKNDPNNVCTKEYTNKEKKKKKNSTLVWGFGQGRCEEFLVSENTDSAGAIYHAW